MSTQRYTTPELNGRTVYSADGEKLGDVQGVLEDETGTPQYVEIKSGWFGAKRHAIPLDGLARRDDGDDLVVPYTKAQLENAPMLDENDDLTYDGERTMGAYYGTDVREWDDTRDRWLPEEDLSRGPTPETRHPDGARDLETDITQGPTPETRDAIRATSGDPGAAGQPQADPHTRSDIVTPGDDERGGYAAPASQEDARGRTAHDPGMRDDPAVHDTGEIAPVGSGAADGVRNRDMRDTGMRDDPAVSRGHEERMRDPEGGVQGDHRTDDEHARDDRTTPAERRDATRGDHEPDRESVADEMRRRLRRWREDDPAR
ncbi:MAG: PRC-barrel domain-containing protein [Thermoleophilia bacterium]|nr:PRC-barrel domain-containing protein [Thermoleophilia bacterium]